MRFDLASSGLVFVSVVASGITAWMEGNANRARVTVGFMNHGGMWSDLLVMPVLTGFAMPHLTTHWGYLVLVMFFSLAGTLVIHCIWVSSMRRDGTTDHIYPAHMNSRWYLDMSISGWMHVVVMSGLLTIVSMYVIVWMPQWTVLLVSALLLVHVCLGMIQPMWYFRGGELRQWRLKELGLPLIVTVLIGIVTAWKILVQKPA